MSKLLFEQIKANIEHKKGKVLETRNETREELPAFQEKVYRKLVKRIANQKTSPRYKIANVEKINSKLGTLAVVNPLTNRKQKIHVNEVKRPKVNQTESPILDNLSVSSVKPGPSKPLPERRPAPNVSGKTLKPTQGQPKKRDKVKGKTMRPKVNTVQPTPINSRYPLRNRIPKYDDSVVDFQPTNKLVKPETVKFPTEPTIELNCVTVRGRTEFPITRCNHRRTKLSEHSNCTIGYCSDVLSCYCCSQANRIGGYVLLPIGISTTPYL